MDDSENFDLERTRRLISPRLQPGEDLDAAISAGVHLAGRRAQLAERAATQEDLEFALSILCLWPFKTPPADSVERDLRAVRRAPLGAVGRGDFSALDRLVPPSTLARTTQQLATSQQRSVESFLTPEREERST
jgi:hypothetical protein